MPNKNGETGKRYTPSSHFPNFLISQFPLFFFYLPNVTGCVSDMVLPSSSIAVTRSR